MAEQDLVEPVVRVAAAQETAALAMVVLETAARELEMVMETSPVPDSQEVRAVDLLALMDRAALAAAARTAECLAAEAAEAELVEEELAQAEPGAVGWQAAHHGPAAQPATAQADAVAQEESVALRCLAALQPVVEPAQEMEAQAVAVQEAEVQEMVGPATVRALAARALADQVAAGQAVAECRRLRRPLAPTMRRPSGSDSATT